MSAVSAGGSGRDWFKVYELALRQHVDAPGEVSLERAYDIGREMLAAGLGVIEVSTLHASALTHVARERDQPTPGLAARAEVFFREALSPFEMALRGFTSANASLRELNNRLERLVDERTREARDSQRRYQLLVDQAPVAVYVLALEPAPRLTYVSPQLEAILGVRVSEWSFDAWMAALHDADVEEVQEVLGTVRERGHFSLDYRLRGAGDRLVWVRDTAHVGADEQGRPTLHGVLMDVTERHELERRLFQAQKMESIGRLAGGVAHDFNNILSAILSFASFAREVARDDERSLRDDLDQVIKSAQRAVALTRQLLAFSRAQMIEPRVIDSSELLLGVDKLLRRVVGEDVELIVLPASEPYHVRIDPGQLEQVLLNLVVNARDAMPRGGKIILELSSRALAAPQADVPAGDYVVLRVADTGMGMTSEVRERIFEPFFTTKERGRGTGLGLASCYGIAKQAGGWMEVESEPDVGSTFWLFLPRERGPASHIAAGSHTERVPRGNETVLVVEDEDVVRAIAVRALAGYGYHVLDAANGESALALCESYDGTIHLLLTDLVMPRMGGRDLMREAIELRPAMRVMIMSGYAGASAQQTEPGAFMLQKPFTPEILARKVRDVLDAREPGRAEP